MSGQEPPQNLGRFSQAKHEKSSECVLVTPDREMARRLSDAVPAEIQAFTRVQWFPWDTPPTALCQRWLPELSALAWLSKHETPGFQDVAEVLCTLHAVWIMRDGIGNAFDIIEGALQSRLVKLAPLTFDSMEDQLL